MSVSICCSFSLFYKMANFQTDWVWEYLSLRPQVPHRLYLAQFLNRLSSPGQNIKFFDEVESVKQEAAKLKSQGINKIIAVGHAGIDIDIKIAQNVDDVDVVVGGHSNTFLYTGNTIIHITQSWTRLRKYLKKIYCDFFRSYFLRWPCIWRYTIFITVFDFNCLLFVAMCNIFIYTGLNCSKWTLSTF